ncbi:hypothetical protein [Deinococcus sonorensis]|uniref:Uncharacterized protein n=1 Tax=Deinococcus sonorensis TaxID=309891 RepID=A0ABV8YAB4_9DEIO
MRIPQAHDIAEMWNVLDLRPVPEHLPAGEPLLDALRTTRLNGGALYACVHYAAHPVLDYFIQNRHLTGTPFDLLTGVLTHPALRLALPQLDRPLALPAPLPTQVLDVFDLEAGIARAVFRGGAYRDFDGSLRQAKSLAGHFVDAVQGDRRHHWFAHSSQAWSPWFQEACWDDTWVGLDGFKRRLWVLCTTDTD